MQTIRAVGEIAQGTRVGRASLLLVAPRSDTALRDVLTAAGFTICAEAGTQAGTTTLFEAQRPDLVLLDTRAGGDPIEAAAKLLRRYPAARVVILTSDEDIEDFLEAMRLGIVGYVIRPQDPGRLGPALRDVLAGRAAVPRRFLPRLIEELRLL